jgi:hypothetical protein
MYAWLWRTLPGPLPIRLIITVTLAAAAVALLFSVVFPWVESRLPLDDVTIVPS